MKQQTSDKSRMTAVLLSFFLGGFGACRFYTGHKSKGIAMLIMTILIVPAIISAIMNFIDFISLLLGTFKDSEGKIVENW